MTSTVNLNTEDTNEQCLVDCWTAETFKASENLNDVEDIQEVIIDDKLTTVENDIGNLNTIESEIIYNSFLESFDYQVIALKM